MKKYVICLLPFLGMISCSEVSVTDLPRLNRTAMSFNLKGADLGECGLVSQFEKGRSTTGKAAGGG